MEVDKPVATTKRKSRSVFRNFAFCALDVREPPTVFGCSGSIVLGRCELVGTSGFYVMCLREESVIPSAPSQLQLPEMITRRIFVRSAAMLAILGSRLNAQTARSSSGFERRGPGAVEIKLAHGSQQETATREQLRRLLRTYDVSRWIFTTSIIVDEMAIPHSHPVLTLSTRHLHDDELLLSTFVHEQSHWFLVQRGKQTDDAIEELRLVFPTVPARPPEGAADEHSTYLHLLVCYLEHLADRELLGELKARQVMDFWAADHYTWVYKAVLDGPRDIAAIISKHKLIPD
jgi:hypothetical protein